MTLLEQARKYVFEDGFSVFPLVPGEKIPYKKWSWKRLQERRPSDHELAVWFGPCAVNIAIVTGDVSQSLFVLDFDVIELYEAWKRMTGLETRTVKTGNGYHCYFHCPEGFNGDMCLEDGTFAGQARYNGGYVVAPPSAHPSGHRYAWLNDAPILSVSLEVLRVAPKQQRLGTEAGNRPSVRRTPRTLEKPTVTDVARYAETALYNECQTVRTAQEHSRNTTLYRSALKCSKWRDVLGEQTVLTALVQAGTAAGLPSPEALNTVLNAWRVATY